MEAHAAIYIYQHMQQWLTALLYIYQHMQQWLTACSKSTNTLLYIYQHITLHLPTRYSTSTNTVLYIYQHITLHLPTRYSTSTNNLRLYPEWPHRQGGCLACCGCTFESRCCCTDLYYARGAQWVLPMRVGGATSQLDLPSLTRLSVAGCG